MIAKKLQYLLLFGYTVVATIKGWCTFFSLTYLDFIDEKSKILIFLANLTATSGYAIQF